MMLLNWTSCLGLVWGVGRGPQSLLQIQDGESVWSTLTRTTVSLQWCPGDTFFLKTGGWKYPNPDCRFRGAALSMQILGLVTVTRKEVRAGSLFLDLLAAGRISYACYSEYEENKTNWLGNTQYEQFCLTNLEPWTEMVCFLWLWYREHRVTIRMGVIRWTLKFKKMQHNNCYTLPNNLEGAFALWKATTHR